MTRKKRLKQNAKKEEKKVPARWREKKEYSKTLINQKKIISARWRQKKQSAAKNKKISKKKFQRGDDKKKREEK